MFFNVSATVLTGGVAGLELLKSTRDSQEALVRDNTLVKRETEYFEQNIGNITSAEDLVDDPRLLRVALEAYGLGDEFSKKAYIQNILESDLTDPTSAANSVTDPRWTAFAEAFLKSEVTVPGPLNSDFGAKMSQRAYAVELSNYTTQDKIDIINQDAESFRTAMADITTATEFVNNREALNFVKDAFGLSDDASTNEEIVGYLNAFNGFSLNDDGSAVVPDAWKEVRETLSFFNETYIKGTDVTTDKQPNDIATIEEVVLQRFRHELSVETGHYDYTKRQEAFVETMRTYDNVDDFLADEDSLTFVKESFNLTYDITDTATIKGYLTDVYTTDIPAKWQNVREALGFHTGTLTQSTEDMTGFTTDMASYADSVDDFLADSDALNKVKTAYGLENDTTDLATLKTYLTATDESTVPDEFQAMRSALSHYNDMETAVNNFDTTLNNASSFSDLLNDGDFANFILVSYGISGATEKADVANYLLAKDDTNVPDEWKQVRLDLGFYNSDLTTGQQQDSDDLATALGNATDIDDLVDDAAFMATLKTAYGLSDDTASNSEIKTYLLAQSSSDVPEAWQQVRTDLNFFDNTTETDYFEANIPTDATTLVNDATLLNVVKTAFGLGSDTTDTATIESYLNAADDSSVPEEWKEVRTTFGFFEADPEALTDVSTIITNYNANDETITAPDSATITAIQNAYRNEVITVTPPDQSIIDDIKTNYETNIPDYNIANISDLYLTVTGTRDNLEETLDFSTLSDMSDRHKEFNISYLDNISKFDRFKKEADNFELSIGLAASDADIAADGRALRFALTAFGLESESFDSFKAFNVLTGEEPLGQSASDAKWRDFRNNFSFSAAANTLKTGEEDFSSAIIEDFVDNTFIEAVGEQDQDLRLALYFDQRIKELAATDGIDDYGWLQVAGETPLATVFQTAFSLPSSFGSLDLDKQQEIYGLRSQSVIGTPNLSDYVNQNFVDQLIQTYLLRATISATSSGTTASTLLSNSGASGSLF